MLAPCTRGLAAAVSTYPSNTFLLHQEPIKGVHHFEGGSRCLHLIPSSLITRRSGPRRKAARRYGGGLATRLGLGALRALEELFPPQREPAARQCNSVLLRQSPNAECYFDPDRTVP